MTYLAEHNALRTRFQAQWGATTEVAWENAKFDPPDDDPWVRFHLDNIDANQASMGDPGNNVHRHLGLVTIMIFAPLNEGDSTALQLADQAMAVFRGWQSTSPVLRFRKAPYLRIIGREPKWYHVNVLCPYERDSFM